MAKEKLRKSDWLPALILVYFIIMMCVFGPDLLAKGEYLTFGLTAAAELVILVLLRIFLRKREKIGK